MASSVTPPYAPQDKQIVTELVQSLEASSKRSGGGRKAVGCRKTRFEIPGPSGYVVTSWKFQDWDYKRRDLPTYARGLFTLQSDIDAPEIVVRGYDKFFNVNEVHQTSWENIQSNTSGPYELSLKENGCIIFISGLPDETLLVCSKHATGVREDSDVSHAHAGEVWVDKQLEALGKTRADLARELRRRNATAVAELCDDSFEEHILAYQEDQAGLYLHGINLNLPEFATYPGALVHEFADQWGFRKTDYLVKDDIRSVRTFLEEVGKTGAYGGRDVEGFVIRCQARYTESRPWFDWFFKYKYEEPYLMYRQWREATKALIAGKTPKIRKHQKITEEYLLYARRQLAANPSLGREYNRNHGIIAMRNGFLKEKGLRGIDITSGQDDDSTQGSKSVSGNVVLVPVATIGCGKTTVAVALQKLFGWGHVQNDNIKGPKGRPQRFAGEICSALSHQPVVIADRNNHQKRERKQLMGDVHRFVPEARFVALHYIHEIEGVAKYQYHDAIRSVARERVFRRGDNHQTIQAESKSEAEVMGIMNGFLQRFEPVNPDADPDDGFDAVIDLDVMASSRENLEKVVSTLHREYPKLVGKLPEASQIDEAVEAALNSYQPDIKHEVGFSHSKAHHGKQNAHKGPPAPNDRKTPKVDYFCVTVPTKDVLDTLNSVFSSQSAETAQFYRQLAKTRRLQPSFHVTLTHRANASSFPGVWDKYQVLYDEAVAAAAAVRSGDDGSKKKPGGAAGRDIELGSCRVELERVIWDDRVMCIVTRLLDAQEGGFESTNAVAHITVGTAQASIKPKESNELLARWMEKGSGGDSGIGELVIEKKVQLMGKVTGR